MIGGGVTAAYLDDDCWPDLAFTSRTGMQFFRNADGVTYQPMSLLGSDVVTDATGTAVADLDGDYRRELLFGNVRSSTVPVFAKDGVGGYTRIASLPMARPTYGISFAPLDSGQHPYLYFAHWSGGRGTDGTSPALWHNDGQALSPWDWNGGTSAFMVDQRFNFTPKFGDFDNDGLTDLLIASDFKTSMVLRNAGSLDAGPKFENDTNWRVITDENGMGSALLDIDNDGVLEWFVTSVLDHTAAEGNWGVTGNRLYRNVSSCVFHGSRSPVPRDAGQPVHAIPVARST